MITYRPNQSTFSDTLPLISVIIPVYNHANYIETCLDSIYNDDYPNIEVILIDDGSADNSYAVIQQWRAAHPGRFLDFQAYRQENQGTCRTFNRLLSLTNGDFIAPIASDDYFLPGGIRSRLNALQDNPQWLAVFADCNSVDQDGKILSNSVLRHVYRANKQALGDSRFIAIELILKWSVPGPGFMARRQCFDPVEGIGLYNEQMRLVEDRDFYLRLLYRQALGFIDTPVAAYRIHSSNASRRTDYRLAISKSLRDANFLHINKFSGMEKFCLKIVAYYSRTAANYFEFRTLKYFLMYFWTRALVWHTYIIFKSVVLIAGSKRQRGRN